MLRAGLLGGDRRPEAAARHHAGRLRRGAGGQLQGLGQVFRQPLAALGQGLGMGQHLTHARNRAAAKQGMADRQHQGPGDAEIRMLPERVQAGRHPPLH